MSHSNDSCNIDKNLKNVTEDLAQPELGSHAKQQQQQQTNDRRHKDALNHEG
jgi:hypothetical protein